MTTDPSRPTADHAREALAAAGSVNLVSDRDLRVLRRVLIGVALAMASVLLLVRATQGNPTGLIIGMVAYGIVILVLVRWNSTVQASPRGYGKRYGTAIAATSAMYGLGIAFISGTDLTWASTVILAVLTALPGIVGARSITRAEQQR